METLTVSEKLAEVIAIIENFGPNENEYPIFHKIVNEINNEQELLLFRELFMPVLTADTLCGHTYLKPFGYAGDYLLIEKFYQKYISKDPRYCKWDQFYHTYEAVKAVVNRKLYFIKILTQICSNLSGNVKVLILGSGPATDVFEFLSSNPDANITFDLLDIDQRAIDHATSKNKQFLHKIKFMKMNILRFVPEKKYDLIWSAGLFDYLNDRLFIGLMQRFKNNLTLNGEMIIGNFSPDNPSKKYMEIMEWYLIHRSSQQLTQLAVDAGIPNEIITVNKEPLGINLFLHINPCIKQGFQLRKGEIKMEKQLSMY